MSNTDDRQQAYDDRKRAIDAAIEECRGMSIEPVITSLELQGHEASGWFGTACPICGGDDRFQINLDDKGFFCRKRCEAKGQGAIDLVMVVKGLEFMDAVKWLHGDIPDRVDPAEIERRRKLREQSERKKQRNKDYYRDKARKDAIAIWQRAKDHPVDPVRTYLARRGITPDLLKELPKSLRYLPDHAYVVSRKVDGKQQPVTLHRGPAMIAAAQAPDNKLICAHQTWFDLDGPNLKPCIEFHGKKQPNKLTRGSQSRAAIRLITPEGFDTLVMAEGIETTLSAAIAWHNDLGPGVAYWAGISLPHMAGEREGGRYGDTPRMDETAAFVPPPWLKRFFIILDGDSDPKATKAQVTSCARRAMAHNPDLECKIVSAPEGLDMNDVLLGAGGNA